MRPNRPRAAATARKSHARALHARAKKLARAWSARACDSRPAANWNPLRTAWWVPGCCLNAARVLLGRCLGAAWAVLG
eukprot:9377717-Lingulodinium_polyedra.AAC.1